MTIKRYAGDKLVGLSSDTKPTNIPDGATFYETNTLSAYILTGGTWVMLSNVNIVQSNLTSLVNYVYACQTVTNATYSTSNVTNYVGVSYAGTVAITLHTGYTGQRITVKDETGYASANAITLVGSIDNQSNAVLQINNGSLTLIYNNGWRII